MLVGEPRAAGHWWAGGGGPHTNTIEGFFSIFKHGIKGVYQHCSKRHLHRYLAEFDFGYNERKITDTERSDRMLSGIVGRRPTYGDSQWVSQ